MKSFIVFASVLALSQALAWSPAPAQANEGYGPSALSEALSPCDIYSKAGASCVAAHSSTRALLGGYTGPLYQVMRLSDGKTLDIGTLRSNGRANRNEVRIADAAAQDRFCADTYCWMTILYDQSGNHNDLVQPPRGTWSGPAQSGVDTLPVADMAPVSLNGHKVYGVFIAPGMGLRQNDAKGTAVDDQAEGQYWVINGQHFNSGCCFDYGNAEIDSRDDDNGTMEATFYGNTPWWYHGQKPGPWVMTDQENNLVGCVNEDKSNFCKDLPIVTSRFVTAMAKGKPGHWTTLGGDASQGPLSVMFDGRRIDASYDPMRKQGAILLGNGGDNSNGSQGTFYEGAMTAAGTFPSDATDQLIQQNVVSARYGVAPVTIAPKSKPTIPGGLETFSPGSSRDVLVTFTNTTTKLIRNLSIELNTPRSWTAFVAGTKQQFHTVPGAVAPGASVQVTFKVTSGSMSFNGDLKAVASWGHRSKGLGRSETGIEKVRNTAAVKINEFRIQDGSGENITNTFIELYNDSSAPVDLTNWTLDEHPTLEANSPRIVVPAGTILIAKGFYVFGLSNSGLSLPVAVGSTTLQVRNVDGVKPGDTVVIGTGRTAETRKVLSVGTASRIATTVWQPLPDGLITVRPGATNIPVSSVKDITVGDQIGLGYGTTFPIVGRNVEQYEAVTVTAVGTAGNQAYLALNAEAGSSNLQVTSIDGISIGDEIRLDIDSVGHGIETVTVTGVGTIAKRSALAENADAGASEIEVRSKVGFPEEKKFDYAPGAKIIVGNPANLETVNIKSVEADGDTRVKLHLATPLVRTHVAAESVVEPGTGLRLAVPLKYAHAANLPFSARGSGISFSPATKFAHMSDEPVVSLGTGITIDVPLVHDHPLNDVVRDQAVSSAGFQGTPNQWFGGPALSRSAGSMVLRDANGLVADSINYGGLVDPWAGEGDQSASGFDMGGCFAPIPGFPFDSQVDGLATDSSSGRFPDGKDTDNNCQDFTTAASTSVAFLAPAGTMFIKVEKVSDFAVGQSIYIGSGKQAEASTIAAVGTPGATKTLVGYESGSKSLLVEDSSHFVPGQVVTVGEGENQDTATILSANHWDNPNQIEVKEPLDRNYPVGTAVQGSGIKLTRPLALPHEKGAAVVTDLATPGSSNNYSSAQRP